MAYCMCIGDCIWTRDWICMSMSVWVIGSVWVILCLGDCIPMIYVCLGDCIRKSDCICMMSVWVIVSV